MINYLPKNSASLRMISLFIVISLVLSVPTLNLFPAETLAPDKYHPVVGKFITRLLPKYHYNHQTINDSVSAELLKTYLQRLDRNRLFFLASDIAAFEKYRYELDDALASGNLEPAYTIFNTLLERVDQRLGYIRNRLEKEFDFTIDEYFEPDRHEAPYANTVAELNELWRRKLKHEALNLKLAGRDWEKIQTTLKKRYSNLRKRYEQFISEDVFQYFMNALSWTYDPHTGYLTPMSSENFGIDMSLSLEGIGAQLTTEDDYTKVVRILPGGPASRSKQIWPDDRIIGVAQGADGDMVDVIGMRLDEVVKMIRGPKGTTVRLEIIPAKSTPGSPTKEIDLVRDKVVLTEREAHSKTVELQHQGRNLKIGIITIPTFYADLAAQQRGEKDYKSTTRDVRRLLFDLNREEIDGLVIDLRQNGGGSLQEAIELTGLFIKEGPVVQVRNSIGRTKVERDPDPAIAYDGPLAVLVDPYSASASEIFSAAIQDYGRGIIMGSRTFGKGTVQNLFNLNRFIQIGDAKFGQLKVTIAKFYRITGGTTQHRGVIPDLSFPSIRDEMDLGESAQANALPWDQIKPTLFHSEDRVSKYLATLRLKSKQRTAKNPEFQYLLEDIEQYKQKIARNTISLQETKRKQERDRLEAKRLARINERRIAKGLKPLKKGDEIPKDEKAPDALLDESTRILADLISLSRTTETTQITIEEQP
ncbi:MAG: carboxy terminal-processing peptidase [bacterium]